MTAPAGPPPASLSAHRTSVPDVAGVVVVEAVEEGGRVVVLAGM